MVPQTKNICLLRSVEIALCSRSKSSFIRDAVKSNMGFSQPGEPLHISDRSPLATKAALAFWHWGEFATLRCASLLSRPWEPLSHIGTWRKSGSHKSDSRD